MNSTQNKTTGLTINMEKTTLRNRVFQLLEPRATSKLSDRAVDIFLMVLIALNVLAVALESIDEFSDKYKTNFEIFELISVGFGILWQFFDFYGFI